MHYILCFIIGLVTATSMLAQDSSKVSTAALVRVQEYGRILKNAQAGGFNNPQWNAVDLNNDGRLDLMVLDRQPNGIYCTVKTFLNGGTLNSPDYQYAPEYEAQFPKTFQWGILRDYNCDGIMDYFCFADYAQTGGQGVSVYKGSFNAQNKIRFQLVKPSIKYPGQFGIEAIAILSTDFPSIDDVDNDGDMDILAFDYYGARVSMYKNQSHERGYGCDSLIYEWKDDCWGRFYEPALNNSLQLSPRRDSCAGWAGWRPKHAGSTVLTLDADGDGDRDILIGDISFNNMVMGYNGLHKDTAWVSSQDANFPSSDRPINVSTFPVAFHLDLDNDNVKDLIVSPNAVNASETAKVGVFYKNMGTNGSPSFRYQRDSFLVETMVEFGERTVPIFWDYNNDGKTDVLLGHYGFKRPNAEVSTRLRLYENIGTPSNPEFKLVDSDFAALSRFDLQTDFNGIAPTIGDLDGDGDDDLLLGTEIGKIIYFQNIGTPSKPNFNVQPVLKWQSIDVGFKAIPTLFDLNKDGLLDLIIGEEDDQINYFANKGTRTNPVFNSSINPISTFAVPTTSYLGNIVLSTNQLPYGNTAPRFVVQNGVTSLLAGSFQGNIALYNNLYVAGTNNLNLDFNRINRNFGSIDVGYHSAIDAKDINNDGKLDYVMGNLAGGLRFYSEGQLESPLSNEVVENTLTLTVTPNPSTRYIEIYCPQPLPENTLFKVFDMQGRLLQSGRYTTQTNLLKLNIEALESGVYHLQLIDTQERGRSYCTKFSKL